MDYNLIFRRQHPDYRSNRAIWQRSQAACRGGEEYIQQALIQHVSEIDLEFLERRNRAYYFNYPRKIARIITEYLLARSPERINVDPILAGDFTGSGLRVNDLMRQFSTTLNIYGSAWVLVEMPAFSGPVNVWRKVNEKLRPYAVVLSPLAVPDWSYNADGSLEWVLVEENIFDNSNVFAEPVTRRRRRLWTPEEWQLFEEDHGEVKLIDENSHQLGTVPLIHAASADSHSSDTGHWFEDVVRISDAILNNESEAQMNIIKQMFGLLVISENFARGNRPNTQKSKSDQSKFSHILARSAAIWESSEESGISRYISPTGVATNTIRQENQNLKAELFDVIGLTVVRETREMQSAESKAWDHQQICQFLCSRIDLLEQTELAIWQLMNLYDSTVPIPQIAYNRDFTVTDLKESIAGLLELKSFDLGRNFRQEVARTAVTLLDRCRKIPAERQEAIYREICNDLPAVEDEK